MKNALKLVGLTLIALLLAALGMVFFTQQRALQRVGRENGALRRQVEELSAQANHLADLKERLAKLVAAQEQKGGAPLAQEQYNELLRLRGDVGRWRGQERENEQTRQQQMQAAQAKLPEAESRLARLTEAHASKLIGVAELEEARFAVEVLKAQAQGDATGVARIRLRQAESELARAAELRGQSLISQTEYEEAVRKAESARRQVGP